MSFDRWQPRHVSCLCSVSRSEESPELEVVYRVPEVEPRNRETRKEIGQLKSSGKSETWKILQMASWNELDVKSCGATS